jgi:predicted RND superfamily exporter protein
VPTLFTITHRAISMVQQRAFAWLTRQTAARPWWFVVVNVVVTLAAVAVTTGVRFDSSFDQFLIPDSPDIAVYHEFLDRFGNDKALVIGIATDDPFAAKQIAELKALVSDLEKIPGVVKVYSLVSAPSIQGSADELHFAPPVTAPPADTAAREEILARLAADPTLRDRLLSPDGRLLGVLVTLDPPGEDRHMYERITTAARQRLADLGSATYLSGEPVIEADMNRYMRDDLETFVPITLGLAALCLLYLFRNLVGLLVPMAVILASTAWGIAAYILAGRMVNSVTTMIPPLIMVIAASDSVHLLSHYLVRVPELGKRAAIDAMLLRIGPGCFMTSLTTAIGFASLTFSPIPALQDFGQFSAIGVICSFVISMTAVPAALQLLPTPTKVRSDPRRSAAPWMQRLGHLTAERPRPFLLVGLALVVTALIAVPRIEVETDDLTYFRADSPTRRDTDALQAHFGGVRPLDVVLHGQPDSFANPEVLGRIAAFQTWVTTQPGIDGATSAVDLLQALFNQIDDRAVADHSRAALAQGYLFFDLSDTGAAEMARFVTEQRDVAHISLQEGESRTSHLKKQLATIRARLSRDFPDLQPELTGYTHFYTIISNLIVRSQVISLSIAVVTITLVMMMICGSWRLGLLSMVPNIFPIILAMGLMGWAHIPLNSATAMVASIAIGLAVDDTIHFLNHLQQERRHEPRIRAALPNTMQGVARPMVYTSIILGIGFGTLLFSHFVPSVYFAILAVVTVVTALIGDLTLLPALLTFLDDRRTGE